MAEMYLTLNELKKEIEEGKSFQLVEPFFDNKHNILFGTEKVLTSRDLGKLENRFPHLVSKPLRVLTTIPHYIPEDKRIKWSAYIISLFEGGKIFKNQPRNSKEFVIKYLKNTLPENDYAIWKLSQIKAASRKVFEHTCNTCYISLIAYYNYNRFNMQGMIDADKVHKIIIASCLHDVGMTKFDSKMLEKKKIEFTEAEKLFYSQHPQKSFEIINNEKEKHELPQEVIEAIVNHEEYVDSTGAPRGLAGEQMSDISKILSISNYFEQLMSGEWAYRSRTYREYYQRFRAEKNKFDPGLFEAISISFKYLFGL